MIEALLVGASRALSGPVSELILESIWGSSLELPFASWGSRLGAIFDTLFEGPVRSVGTVK